MGVSVHHKNIEIFTAEGYKIVSDIYPTSIKIPFSLNKKNTTLEISQK